MRKFGTKNNPAMQCVYQIENNGKKYIGRTCEPVENRLWSHGRALLNGVHPNPLMVADYKAGNWNPTCKRISEYLPKDEARLLEDQLMNEVDIQDSYNIRQRRAEPQQRLTQEEKIELILEVQKIMNLGMNVTRAIRLVSEGSGISASSIRLFMIAYAVKQVNPDAKHSDCYGTVWTGKPLHILKSKLAAGAI